MSCRLLCYTCTLNELSLLIIYGMALVINDSQAIKPTEHQHQENLCMRASRASELGIFSHFHIPKLILLSLFFLVALIALFIDVHVPTKLRKCIIEVAIFFGMGGG